jgi:hypothetical protein
MQAVCIRRMDWVGRIYMFGAVHKPADSCRDAIQIGLQKPCHCPIQLKNEGNEGSFAWNEAQFCAGRWSTVQEVKLSLCLVKHTPWRRLIIFSLAEYSTIQDTVLLPYPLMFIETHLMLVLFFGGQFTLTLNGGGCRLHAPHALFLRNESAVTFGEGSERSHCRLERVVSFSFLRWGETEFTSYVGHYTNAGW